MTSLLLLFLAALPLLCSSRSALYPRAPRRGGGGGGGGGSGGAPKNVTTYLGDGLCLPPMCITATVENNTVNYQLTSRGVGLGGWLALGWGKEMNGSEMVILWSNGNGDVTLSQRRGSGHNQPLVDLNPSMTANLSSTLFGQNTQGHIAYAFSVPHAGEGKTHLIWAVGADTPSSSAVDAEIEQHSSMGKVFFDLSRKTTVNPHSIVSDGRQMPLSMYENLMLAHGFFCTFGFVVLLPVGSLLARWFRTFWPKWLKNHWITQFNTAGIIILVGIVLGVVATQLPGDLHLNDAHKRSGIALLAMYIIQLVLGFITYKLMPKSGKRPPQNYIHVVLGLVIIGFAFWQVRVGYQEEFPAFRGRELGNGANIAWLVLVIIVAVAYIGGLGFLPRQFRKEKEYRTQKAVDL